MDADLDTLATALYVTADDLFATTPSVPRFDPRVGWQPQISDAELLTVAVMQALLGFSSERRWLRYAHAHLRDLFPNLPAQSGYNKRLASWPTHGLAVERTGCTYQHRTTTCGWSTPPRSNAGTFTRDRERSDLAGWADTATAPRTAVTSGACACIWCAPCTDSRSAGH